jgi:hypothetical protein
VQRTVKKLQLCSIGQRFKNLIVTLWLENKKGATHREEIRLLFAREKALFLSN